MVIKRYTAIYSVAFLMCFMPVNAWADCVGPPAPAGRIDYFDATDVFKYCNGTDWVSWSEIESVSGIPAPSAFNNLNDLADVDAASPSDDECLVHSGGDWVNGSCGGSGVWSTGTGDDIYYNTGAHNVGIGVSDPTVELDIDGDIHYTGVIVDTSDRNLKDNIQPLHQMLEKVSRLNGYSFEMKQRPEAGTEYGVVAQEVQAVFPELVHEIDSDGSLGVSYNGLIAPMIEAIKELKAENELLKSRLDRLENEAVKQ